MDMGDKRKKYTKEFKLEAVRMLEAGEKNGREIEKDLGIGSGQVYRWRKELEAAGTERCRATGVGLWAYQGLSCRGSVRRCTQSRFLQRHG